MRELDVDVAVVGAGPAGLAAAAAAAEDDGRVVLIDENPAPGGQVWRAHHGAARPEVAALVRRARNAGAQVLFGTAVYDARDPRRLLASDAQGPVAIANRALVLATGASERFLPFPGWTTPGVVGAGGLQALIKTGLRVHGARVAVAGSGPLLLAVAALARAHGAHVTGLFECAPRASHWRVGAALLGHGGKLQAALELGAALNGVPRHFRAWPLRASAHAGSGELARATFHTPDGALDLELDFLACGFGLVGRTELAQVAGCAVEGGRVLTDRQQAASVEGVWCAGEPCGVGGLECALAEGEVAGHAAAGCPQRAQAAGVRRDRERRLAAALERAFALPEALRELAGPGEVVCRCEDVRMGDLAGCADAREAKLLTRCGMGPCQGRVCGPALAFLRGWEREAPRAPLVPVPLAHLCEPATSTP